MKAVQESCRKQSTAAVVVEPAKTIAERLYGEEAVMPRRTISYVHRTAKLTLSDMSVLSTTQIIDTKGMVS